MAALILTVPTAVALWLTFQHIPIWYKPPEVNEAMVLRARSDLTGVFDVISDKVVGGERFDIVLHEETINQWLAAAPQVWPGVTRSVPREVTESAVALEDDRIRIGVRVQRGGWQAILSVDLTVAVSDDGRNLTVTLAGLRGGSLPAPRALLRKMFDPLLEQARRRPPNQTDGANGLLSALRHVRSVDELFAGILVENRFVWPNGRRPVRIHSISIEDHALRLVVDPIR